MHSRIQIRNAVYARLQQHPDLTALFEARTKPSGEEKLPFANVTTGSETSEELGDWGEMRNLQVQVTLYERMEQGVVDRLDELAEKVEAYLGADQRLGGVCDSFRYKGCEPDYTSAAAQEAASLTLNYECKYQWAPDPTVDVFGTVEVSIDMAGPRNEPQLPSHPDGQIDSVDVITLPQ